MPRKGISPRINQYIWHVEDNLRGKRAGAEREMASKVSHPTLLEGPSKMQKELLAVALHAESIIKTCLRKLPLLEEFWLTKCWFKGGYCSYISKILQRSSNEGSNIEAWGQNTAKEVCNCLGVSSRELRGGLGIQFFP